MRDSALAEGTPTDALYPPIFTVLAGLLLVAFFANLLIRPVNERFRVVDEDRAAQTLADRPTAEGAAEAHRGSTFLLAWAAVLLPIGWGLGKTFEKVIVLLR